MSTQIYGNGKLCDNSKMYGNSKMYDNSAMHGNSKMFDNSKMHDDSLMFGDSQMHDNSQMFDNSAMYGSSLIRDNSKMFDNSQVHGNAKLSGNAIIAESHVINFGIVDYDARLRENLPKLITNSLGIGFVNGHITLFKIVLLTGNPNIFQSEFDCTFTYEIGKVCEAPEVDENPTVACGKGLHASHYHYSSMPKSINSAVIAISIGLDDIVCCQESKVRFRKGLVLGCCERSTII